jgi:curved DNA-binding protein CbpA
MDDYYSLLGIDADATVDDIRGAYRVRKDGLDTGSEAGRADAVKLNKAWNVLSDPYQRGRYDEQRTTAAEEGTLDADADEAAPSANGSGTKGLRASAKNSRQERQRSVREARAARMKKPTITLPAGTAFPTPRRRIVAMVIDLGVLILLFSASQMLMLSLEKSQHRTAYDARQELVNHKIPDAQKQTSADNKQLDAATKANNASDIKTYKDKVAADKATESDLNKQLDSLDSTMSDVVQETTIGFFVIGFLYLVLPSALTGRTLGKRLQKIRVVREDGSRLGLQAVVRYGMIVVATYALSSILGPIGAAIVLFGVTMWMRNPNMQGLHDRFAHTIVVSDAAD